MQLLNRIKSVMLEQKVSVYRMAVDLDIHYPTMHSLVNRETLNDTTLVSIVRVADYLEVPITNLYEKL
ncbi:MAG: helix-turn-helix domain-containing protein [Peptococcaceae bacterium]|nr:helix-turn-helix domain-containing protein [Peptococcaceae bacterium]